MSLFMPRADARDQQQDRLRTGRVAETIRGVCEELDREIEGLNRRYQASRDDASAMMLAFENDAVVDKVERRLDQAEAAMVYCEKRTARLRSLRTEFASLLARTSQMA